MRVNIYAEEMPSEPRLEIISKEIEGQTFTALRIYLELPATVDGKQYQGPFMHRPGDDDSAAVTFWGKRDLRVTLRRALEMLDEHYAKRPCHAEDCAIRAGDVVHHEPTGEDWVVAYVDGEHLAWCGWPDGEAKLSDCWLKKSCTDEEHYAFLRELAASSGKRAKRAQRALAALPARRADR